MGNLIVKDNALIESSHRLNEVEQRLILLAILKIREKFDTVESAQNQELTIHADDYMQLFDVDRHAAYKSLRKAVMGLFEQKWGYQRINKRGNIEVVYERFTQSAKYVEAEATVKFMFSTAIIPMLVEIERNFTAYNKEQIKRLSGQYSLRFFELLMRFFDKKTGKGWFEISLSDLRFRFGLHEHEYSLMSNFKKFVLDYSMNQINENTDYSVSYEQKKQGRKIVAFRFDIKSKAKDKSQKNKERDTNTVDMFDNLTDKEREIVAQKNSYADSNNLTPQHRQNLINKALEQHRQAENEAKIERQRKEQAKKDAQKQVNDELSHALKVYEQLLNADDATIEKFIIANAKFLGNGGEKFYFERKDYRQVLCIIKYKFETLSTFRVLNLSVLGE